MIDARPVDVPVAEVRDLAVTFFTPRGTVRAVRDVSFEIRPGEVLGLVGESGCGKSTVAFAMMGYLPGITRVDGDILFEGADVSTMPAAELQDLRGSRIAMVYQDPATALNPTMRVGPQLEEVLKRHTDLNSEQSRERTAELFESVGLADPTRIGRRYPHQLSGGMQQRVVIAMALACDPHLLIMDEPTTGLDVTTEATILDLVIELKDRVSAAILFVSHNLGVIARVADRVTVMYAGQTVEHGLARDIFKSPRHPYTSGLISCVPQPPTDEGQGDRLTSIPGAVYTAQEEGGESCLFALRCPIAQESCNNQAPSMASTGDGHFARCLFPDDVAPEIWGESQIRVEELTDEEPEPVLEARGLRRFYGRQRKRYGFFGPKGRPPVRALVDIDFDIGSGRTLGVVGESGSGKTTAARAVVGLVPRSSGDLQLEGDDLARSVEDRTGDQRAAMRMVFQNPTASLNPRLPVRHAIIRSLRKLAGLSKSESEDRAVELMEAVGLDPTYLDRHPVELSGGEQQRVALAGAFSANPTLIVADEAVSALDVSVQAQVLNLLEEHQRETGTSYMFITHDLGVVRYVSDDILVLYARHVAEYGPAEAVLNTPSHPYTEALLSAAPVPDPDAEPAHIRLEGSVPTLRSAFKGCFFAGRCPRKVGDVCDSTPPSRLEGTEEGHDVYCHIPLAELTEMASTPPERDVASTPAD